MLSLLRGFNSDEFKYICSKQFIFGYEVRILCRNIHAAQNVLSITSHHITDKYLNNGNVCVCVCVRYVSIKIILTLEVTQRVCLQHLHKKSECVCS